MKLHPSRVLSTTLALSLTAVLVVPAVADLAQKQLTADTGLDVYVDSEKLDPRDANGNAVDVLAVDGTTYLPVRALSDALGVDAAYQADDSGAYRINVDTLKKDGKAADYLKTYFGIDAFSGPVSDKAFNAALVKIGGSELEYGDPFTVGQAVKASVSAAGLKELALTYSAEKANAAVAGCGKVQADFLPYVACALDSSLASSTWDFSAALDADTAAQLLMNAVDLSGQGRSYLGDVSDPDIGQKLRSAWATFGNFNDDKLYQLGTDLVLQGASTGYNVKYDGYNAKFLPGYTLTYGHSDITHAVQLVALLSSEGVNAKVALEPKTSIYEYDVSWGDPAKLTMTPTYEVKAIDGGRYLCYATEYDMKLEFDTVAEKNGFDAIVGQYAKKWDTNTDADGKPTTPLLSEAWWQPLYYSTVPLESDADGAYVSIKDNTIHNGPYTLHSFSTADGTAAIAKVAKEKAADLTVEPVDLYVNKAFHNYLTGADHQ